MSVVPWIFWKVLEILLKQYSLMKRVENYCLSESVQFPRSHTKEWFWHLLWKDSVWFTGKVRGEAISRGCYNISSPWDFSSRSNFCTIWEALLMFNWIIFQIPYKEKILTFMCQRQSVVFQKHLQKTIIYLYDLGILAPSDILVVSWIFWKTVEILLN